MMTLPITDETERAGPCAPCNLWLTIGAGPPEVKNSRHAAVLESAHEGMPDVWRDDASQ